MGKVKGNISASERVDVSRTAQVYGDITAARVAIEDGAYFEGNTKLARPKPTKQTFVSNAISLEMQGSDDPFGVNHLVPR